MSKLILKIYKSSRRSAADQPSQPDEASPKSEHAVPPTPDLRNGSREDRVTKVSYKVLIPLEGEGFTQDASRDGFRVFLDKPVPPGAVMEMKFRELNSGDTHSHPIGKVVWQKDHMAGIKVLRK
jgi:hypothetical protein